MTPLQTRAGGRVAGVFLGVALLSSNALAAPVIAEAVARRPSRVHPDAARAFLQGAGGGPAAGPPSAAASQLTEAREALVRGEGDYLAVKLEAAEGALASAVDGFLADPTLLDDAEPAVRATLLLAQIRVARRAPAEADAVLERALLSLPGYPRGGLPPPDIQGRIKAVRRQLAPKLRADLKVITRPPGAEVRINGVRVGRAPVDLPGSAVGVVQITAKMEQRTLARRVELRPGAQRVEIDFDAPAVSTGAFEEALRQGDAPRAFRAAAGLQRAGGASSVCGALLVGDRVYLVKVDGVGELTKAAASPAPVAVADWRRLGARCLEPIGEPISEERVSAEIWRPPPTVEDLTGQAPAVSRTGWGWAAVGGGAAAAGLGAWLGTQATSAADDFNRTGLAADEDRARQRAALADVSFTVAVGLAATGIYLLLTEDGQR